MEGSMPPRARNPRQSTRRRPSLDKINVAIIGVGNCASSLVQGVHFYRGVDSDSNVPGLMHTNLGGYHISDIEFVAAIDVDVNKVGKALSEAIFTPPNTPHKSADVPPLGVKVSRGMTRDGIGKYLAPVVHKASGPAGGVGQKLRVSPP